MSDENQAVKLGIEVDASKAVPVLNDVAAATTKVTEAAVDGGKKIVESSKEQHHWHGQAKAALKGLAQEFPELAHLAHLALNPITLATTGIVGAIALWNAKVKEVQSTYASMELPDLSPPDPARINASLAAWKTYGDNLKHIADTMYGIEASTARTLAGITSTAAALKQMHELQAKKTGAANRPGMDDFLEHEAARAEYQARIKEAKALEARAAGKQSKATGAHIAGEGTDQKNLAELEAQAKAAEESKAKEMARLKDIKNATDPDITGFAALGPSLRVIWRQFANGTDTQGLADIANQNIDSADAVIDRYNRRRVAAPGRDAKRKSRDENYAGAASDLGLAASTRMEAETNWKNANVRYAIGLRDAGVPVRGTPTGAGPSVSYEGMKEEARLRALNDALIKEFEKFVKTWAGMNSRINATNLPAKTAPAL